MRIDVKRTLILLAIYMLTPSFGHALDLDATVDDEIRKNYNPNQLIQDVNIKEESALEKSLKSDTPDEALPALPNITNSTKSSDVKSGNTISVPYTPPPIATTRGNIKIRIPKLVDDFLQKIRTQKNTAQNGLFGFFAVRRPAAPKVVARAFGKIAFLAGRTTRAAAPRRSSGLIHDGIRAVHDSSGFRRS